MTAIHRVAVLAIAVFCLCLHRYASGQNYALDRQSTCGQTLVVYDTDLQLTARSNVAPANPPLECIVRLQSAYEKADGRYRLQIILEQLQIEDCAVFLAIFNGWGVSGNYLRNIGCSSSSTDIIYTTGREATVRFTRPSVLYQTAYAVTITIRTYADANELGTLTGVDKLSTGAIIGIVIGFIAVVAVGILLCWCCKSGYLYSFVEGAGFVSPRKKQKQAGSVDSGLEKASNASSTTNLKNGINYQDPVMWSSITGDGTAKFQRGIPRRASGRGGGNNDNTLEMRTRVGNLGAAARDNYENEYRMQGNTGKPPAKDSQLYEPYDEERASPRFRKRNEPGGSNRSRGSRRSRNSAGDPNEKALAAADTGSKETLIDDPCPGMGAASEDEVRTTDSEFMDNPDAEKLKTGQLQGEADVDTITSPIHVNAGVRASIPDLSAEPEQPPKSPRAKKRSSTSPKSRKKHRGLGPDPMGLPPEAFEPVFTTPTSQEQYPGEFNPMGMAPMFAPYGMFPMAPGGQAYAYAYQTVPQYGGYPGQAPVEGAYYVQSVPTADGNMQNTAFMMQKSKTPQHKHSRPGFGAQSPAFTSTPGSSPRTGHVPRSDMDIVAAGAVPPDPGAGQRTMAMKSFADPNSGMQTTQVLWTDTVPDSSDPGPGDSSQVTRKNMTRVTTRSGHGDLPTQTATLLDYVDPNPAFLSPSTPQRPLHHPAAITPNATNIDYYTGGTHAPSVAPDVIHEAPSRSGRFRDQINFNQSNA